MSIFNRNITNKKGEPHSPSLGTDTELAKRLVHLEIEGETDWEQRFDKIKSWITGAQKGDQLALNCLNHWATDPLSYFPKNASIWEKLTNLLVEYEEFSEYCDNWYAIAYRNCWNFYDREFEMAIWSNIIETKPFRSSGSLKSIALFHLFYSDPFNQQESFWWAAKQFKIHIVEYGPKFSTFVKELEKKPLQDPEWFIVASIYLAFSPEKMSEDLFRIWKQHAKPSYLSHAKTVFEKNKNISQDVKISFYLDWLHHKQELTKSDLFNLMETRSAAYHWVKWYAAIFNWVEDYSVKLSESSPNANSITEDARTKIFQKTSQACPKNKLSNLVTQVLWKGISQKEAYFISFSLWHSLQYASKNPNLTAQNEKYKIPKTASSDLVTVFQFIFPKANFSWITAKAEVYSKSVSSNSSHPFLASYQLIESITALSRWDFDIRNLPIAKYDEQLEIPLDSQFVLKSFWLKLTCILCPDIYWISLGLVKAERELKESIRAFVTCPLFEQLRLERGGIIFKGEPPV